MWGGLRVLLVKYKVRRRISINLTIIASSITCRNLERSENMFSTIFLIRRRRFLIICAPSCCYITYSRCTQLVEIIGWKT